MRRPDRDRADRVRAAAQDVAARLGGRALASAESCTAGRVAAACAAVDGAAGWFRGGVVAYQLGIERALLDVEAPSAMTAAAAAEMASGVAALLDARASVATTGVVGVEPEEGVPPGTVFIATYVDGEVDSGCHRFDGDPEEVCNAATMCALSLLAGHLGRRDSP